MSEMEVEKPDLTLYNTMTQLKEVYKPMNPGKIGIYVCGITAYDYSHIGHARAAVSFDLLYRYLRHLGYQVTYVRNFTDVDDKAKNCGEKPLDLSNRFCEEYLLDMAALQCLLPTHQPRVSDHMEQIIKMIEKIIENGCGYAVGGDVFFSVDKSPSYGQLSGQRLDHTQAGKRVAVDSRKRNPADFALRKAAKSGEPSWESPWGQGRPGWHIEFDIHGGGADLKFPHHENEIAQTCAACEDSGVNYWLHNGHVTNNNVKMGKSLNNFFTIRQIAANYHPLALRHFLMSAQYRSPLNYSVSQVESSSDALYCVYQKKQRMSLVVSLVEVEKAVREVLDVLGLLTTLSYGELLKDMKQKALTRAGMGEEEVLQRIEERNMARKSKDFRRSDRIRELLAFKGIFLEDVPGDTVWRPSTPLTKPKSGLGLGMTAIVFAIVFTFLGFFFYSR
ncbi:tRNA synthetases class I catalytic domain [Arabidopsis suecica]|uniref:tRNA synthetases class I catalytic domain n=1 Tax=Arabidopsis suecica TaxID=45249 RepID=A0A8T2FI78_ARASU|nr:tRNA synthetases class I catalytic domain [Arabidopsis suecica]